MSVLELFFIFIGFLLFKFSETRSRKNGKANTTSSLILIGFRIKMSDI